MKLVKFFSSTIGKKILVAATGLFMIIFLILHLAGNLEIFSGAKAINDYSAFLHSMPKVLWSFRLALIASVIVHIWLTISLTRHNRGARGNYAIKKSRRATLASRTMMVSGITILVFVLYHLAHYTLGITDPQLSRLIDDQGRHHVYNMMVMGFSHPLVSGFYILAQVLLAFHLSHGFSSAARTLGVSNQRMFHIIRKFSVGFAAIVAILYISIPLSVILGFLPLDH